MDYLKSVSGKVSYYVYAKLVLICSFCKSEILIISNQNSLFSDMYHFFDEYKADFGVVKI